MARQLFTPSAVCRVATCACSSVAPRPRCSPKVRLRAERRGAGGDQVTHAGQAGEGERVGAEGHAQPGGLGQAAGDQRRPGVVAETHRGGDAVRQGDHVLHRPAQLAADHVVVGVGAEVRRGDRRSAPAWPGRGRCRRPRWRPAARRRSPAPGWARRPPPPGRPPPWRSRRSPRSSAWWCRARCPSSGRPAWRRDAGARPSSARLPRSVWDGTASTTISAPLIASAASPVAVTRSRQPHPGQVLRVAAAACGWRRRPTAAGPRR